LPDLDLDDIQGLIARGYPDLTAARYVLLQIDDAASACRWLGGLADQVTPGPEEPDRPTARTDPVDLRGRQRVGHDDTGEPEIAAQHRADDERGEDSHVVGVQLGVVGQ